MIVHCVTRWRKFFVHQYITSEAFCHASNGISFVLINKNDVFSTEEWLLLAMPVLFICYYGSIWSTVELGAGAASANKRQGA